MASKTQLMKTDVETLRAMAVEAGLDVSEETAKSKIVVKLLEHAASNWVEVNQEIMSEEEALEEPDIMQGFAGHVGETLSDSAKVAEMLDAAGFNNTFRSVMSEGELWQLEAMEEYFDRLGAEPDKVLMHLPKGNPEEPEKDFKVLNAYVRDTLSDYQDVMPKLEGHADGDIMKEFTTEQGDISDSYSHLASAYLQKDFYGSEEDYVKDLEGVTKRLESKMDGGKFMEVASSNARALSSEKTKDKLVPYTSLMPQIGDPEIVGKARYPRTPLNAAGLPLGSVGSAVGARSNYSLIASLTGKPEGNTEFDKAVRDELGSTLKSMSKVFRGGSDKGLAPYSHQTSEFDMIMDSATRYVDVEDARSGYNNLEPDSQYSASTIRSVIENDYDKMDSQPSAAPSIPKQAPIRDNSFEEQSTPQNEPESLEDNQPNFTADFVPATYYNDARERREAIEAANIDAASANFRDVADYGTGSVEQPESKPTYHDAFEQGTQEWLDFREKYDITGSTVGSYLGNNKLVSADGEMRDKLLGKNLDPNSPDLVRGHRLEPIARNRVSKQFGFPIEEVGAITNEEYPNMLYSPDGLIGDDALWEHKAPRQFQDIHKDKRNYLDQVQLGMLLSGRDKTLFSQTVGDETRSEWIDKDPDWYEENKHKLDSVLGRMDLGREFIEENQDMEPRQLRRSLLKELVGDGIWPSARKELGVSRGVTAEAGTENDPYLNLGRSTHVEPEDIKSDYVPNWTTPSQNESGNVTQYPVSGQESHTALSVKEGILLADDELKQREQAGSTANERRRRTPLLPGEDTTEEWEDKFEDWFRSPIGGGGGGGRRGGKGKPDDDEDKPSNFGNAIIGGIQSGSLSGLQGGFMRELQNAGPIGGTIAGAIGVASIGGEVVGGMNDYLGRAQDYGSDNPIGFDAQQQSMEMLGLNQRQAQQANETAHSAFNRMANGDPSAAVNIAVQTRGLLTLSDIHDSGGDPVKLAAIFRQRAAERGYSPERTAGAAEMAGLSGFARATQSSQKVTDAALGNDDAKNNTDTSVFNENVREENAARAYVSPDYFAQRLAAENYTTLTGQGSVTGAMIAGYKGIDITSDAVEKGVSLATNTPTNTRDTSEDSPLARATQKLESGGDINATNPVSSAKGSMQVLDGTSRDPGYGVVPAKDNSLQERDRVGRDYIDALTKHFDGDERKAAAAYVAGPGALEDAVSKHGNDWINHIRPEAKSRVQKLEQLGMFGSEGAARFKDVGTQLNGTGQTNISVQINAKVNNQEASGVARVVGGQSAAEVINMSGAVSQRR